MTQTAYDHQITVGSTPYNLRLARDSNGKALYSVYEEVPEHSQILEVGQKDWTGGHGQYEYQNNTMYYDGQSIDTTNEGRVILGPLINEVYQTSTTIKDSYEAGADSNSTIIGSPTARWAAQTFTAGSNYTISAVEVKMARMFGPGTITVSIRATTAGVPSGEALSSGTFDGNSLPDGLPSAAWQLVNMTSYALVSGTVYALCVQSTGNYGLWVTDTSAGYAGAHYSSYDGGSTWSTTDATYGNMATWDAYFRTYATASTALESTPTCFHWSPTASKLLCADSTEIYHYTGGAWVEATTAVAGVRQFVEYNGVTYAATGATSKYYYSTDGGTWTITDLDDGTAYKFLVAPNLDGTQNVLWKVNGTNQLSFTTDGRTVGSGGVAWSNPPAYIGDTSSAITTPFLAGDQIGVGRADNLFHYDSNGGIRAQMIELQNQRSSINFKYVTNWQHATYFSLVNGVGELQGNFDNGIFKLMGPLQDTGDIDKVGVVRGIASDSTFLYVAMLEGVATHIYKGRPMPNGSWSWCPFVYLGTNQCDTIAIAQHSETDRRLWFGYGAHTGYVYLSDNPTADANYRFAPNGYLYTSYFYGNNPYWDKIINTVVIDADCSSDSYIDLYEKYREAGGSTTEVRFRLSPATITESGVSKIDGTYAYSGKRWNFKIHLYTTDPLETPELRSLIFRGTEKPEMHRIHSATYLGYDDPYHRNKTIRDALRAARTSTSLVKFADVRYADESTTTPGAVEGTNYQNVTMCAGYPREIEIYHEKNTEPQTGIEVKWQEV